MLKSIQLLRGVAAWLVVLQHINQLIFNPQIGGSHISSPFEKLASGVDLFFVISGFIIYNCATDSRTTPTEFFIKRILRIVPPYWFYTLLAVAITIIYPGVIFNATLNSNEIVKSMLFIPYFDYNFGIYLPFLSVGWTLNYEMLFYAASFIAIILSKRSYALIVSVIIISVHFFSAYATKSVQFYSWDIIYEFLFGVYASMIYKSGLLSRIHPLISCTLIIGSVISIYCSENNHDILLVGIPCGIIVLAAISLEEIVKNSAVMRLISKLGDWSYSTYLCHVIVICTLMQMHRLEMINQWTAALFSLLVTGLISHLSFRYIEKTSSGIYKRILFGAVKKA